MEYPDKTLAQIAADPFLQKCCTIEKQGGETVIKINVMAEIRIPDVVIADQPTSRNTLPALVQRMVAERFQVDLDFDVWPTLRTKLKSYFSARSK